MGYVRLRQRHLHQLQPSRRPAVEGRLGHRLSSAAANRSRRGARRAREDLARRPAGRRRRLQPRSRSAGARVGDADGGAVARLSGFGVVRTGGEGIHRRHSRAGDLWVDTKCRVIKILKRPVDRESCCPRHARSSSSKPNRRPAGRYEMDGGVGPVQPAAGRRWHRRSGYVLRAMRKARSVFLGSASHPGASSAIASSASSKLAITGS